jgi:tetratricopeptide (TPR) repeat protein
MAIWYYRLADIDVYWAATGNAIKYADAFSLYEKAARLFPGNAVILNKWAFALILKGDYAGAVARLNEAEISDPLWIQTAYLEGLAQGSLGHSDQAAQLYLSPDPNKLGAVRYFINFCSLAADFGKAPIVRDTLKSQMDSFKGDWIGFTFLGISDVYTGYFEEAIQAFRQSALLVPEGDRLLLAGTIKTMFSNNSKYQPMAQEIISTLVGTKVQSQ